MSNAQKSHAHTKLRAYGEKRHENRVRLQDALDREAMLRGQWHENVCYEAGPHVAYVPDPTGGESVSYTPPVEDFLAAPRGRSWVKPRLVEVRQLQRAYRKRIRELEHVPASLNDAAVTLALGAKGRQRKAKRGAPPKRGKRAPRRKTVRRKAVRRST